MIDQADFRPSGKVLKLVAVEGFDAGDVRIEELHRPRYARDERLIDAAHMAQDEGLD